MIYASNYSADIIKFEITYPVVSVLDCVFNSRVMSMKHIAVRNFGIVNAFL